MVEFVRINPRIVFGLTEAQAISLALMAIGAWRLVATRGLSVHAAPSFSPSKQ
jgi:hypothetical protein